MLGIDDIIGAGLKIIDKFIPDPAAKLAAQQELQRMQKDELLSLVGAAKDVDVGQLKVNEAEAGSSSLFVSGWRPGVGWVCVVSLALYFIPRFVLGMMFWCRVAWNSEGTLPPMPEMGIGDILGLVGTLLGASTIRMVEKLKGVARA
jgi:hypothetical protein